VLVADLWNRRRRERPFSRAWLIRWAKRYLAFPDLLKADLKKAYLRWLGAKVGRTCICSNLSIEGNASNLAVGERTFIGRVRVTLHAAIGIGDNVTINDDVKLLTASHNVRSGRWETVVLPITIRNYAWIAEGAVLLPGVTIGEGAVVGAYAVVRNDVPEGFLAIGNPATVTDIKRIGPFTYEPTRGPAFVQAWKGPVS